MASRQLLSFKVPTLTSKYQHCFEDRKIICTNVMNRLHIFSGRQRLLGNPFVHLSKSRYSSSSGKNEHSDTEVAKDERKEGDTKNNEAAAKLNKLLLQMAEDSTAAKLDLAKPIPKRKRAEPRHEAAAADISFEKRLESAAKEVAHEVGGDRKRVESELLSKLLSISNKDNKEANVSLSSLVKGMKIESDSKSREQLSRAQQVKQLLNLARRNDVKTRSTPKRSERRGTPKVPLQGSIQKVNVFGSESLGLFKKDLKDEGITNDKWRALHEKELQLAVTHPPANYFQQMIQWTEAGKIWRFPIDNEQDLQGEKDVYFTEHVFMEKHLEPWCPPKGPVRHFMELVCVGLSKNPYMSVETKKGHIEWYRKYFEDKIELLKEVGAIPAQSKSKQTTGISHK